MLERNVQDPLETHPVSCPKDQGISEMDDNCQMESVTECHYFFRSGILEKTQSGSNLSAFTPRFMWIRIALFEKLLQKIVAHLVSHSDM